MQYKIQAWTDALRDLGVGDDSLAAELAQAFERDRRMRHVVFPESRQVLAELKKDYQLALITNGAIDIQRDKINGSNLGEFFDTTIISGELGFGKPNRQVFQTALDRLKVPPERSVMIGDSLRRDIAGARDAGIRTIWVNRLKARIADHHPTPDLELSNLLGLPAILAPDPL
jgi:putative hydrolase of the HAD superfamily